MNRSIKWFVAPHGCAANEMVAEFLQTEAVIKPCRLKSGKVCDVRVYEATETQIVDMQKSDRRFSRDFYRQEGDKLPTYWEPEATVRKTPAALAHSPIAP